MDSEPHAPANQSSCSKCNSTETFSTIRPGDSSSPSLAQDKLEIDSNENTKPKLAETTQAYQTSKDVPKAYQPPRTACEYKDALRSSSPEGIQDSRLPELSRPSPDEISQAFSNWLATFAPKRGWLGLKCFEEAGDKPPISPHSLNELEIERVVNNAKLRHDINFDRELHFRPNLEGQRAQFKLKEADDYWIALETELEFYTFMNQSEAGVPFQWTSLWIAAFRKHQRRIPNMFEALKKIILGMMPLRDRSMVEQTFDVSLIMQRIQRGSFDISVLAAWLSKLLKTHCAPIRDQCIDQMEIQMCQSAGRDAKIAVEGLKELFGVLEAMKLDIANHQIRNLRPQLLNTTTVFERFYNERRLGLGQVDVEEANAWYLQPSYDVLVSQSKHPDLYRFTCCLIGSLLPLPASNPPMPPLPGTFSLDFDRLYQLHRKISTVVNEETCILRLKCILLKHHRSKRDTDLLVSDLREALPKIVGDSWKTATGHVAVELVRLAAKRQRDTWANDNNLSGPNAADRVEITEAQLQQDLQVGGELHRNQTESLRTKLLQSVTPMVERHMNMSPLEIFDSLVDDPCDEHELVLPIGVRPPPTSIHPNAKFDEVCRRLTHIIVLQWRAWGSLVFTRNS